MDAVFRGLSRILPLLAFTVVVFGAYVRLTDAGLGCPDWPGCYGELAVPERAEDVHARDPAWASRPLDAGKAWREMIHRYLASLLGLGIVVMAAAATRRVRRGRSNLVPWLLVPLVVFQGLLGMWTVTLLLKPVVVSAHLLGGFATLALLWWNLLDCESDRAGLARQGAALTAGTVALVLLACQIFLGGWTSANYAALACTDFPTCHGRWWPETDFGEAFVLWRGVGVDYEFGVLDTPARTAIHLTHRLGALVASLALAVAALTAIRSRTRGLAGAGWTVLVLLGGQVALGISNVVFGLPLPVAVAHNAGAACLLLALVTLLFFARGAPRRMRGVSLA